MVVLLEACRRVAGLILTTVVLIFIVYVFLGPYLPGMFSHLGMSVERFIDLQVLSTSGIFGTPISASAHMVFYFVIVGACLERSGGGKLFVDIAYGFTARSWGGAGKAAVIASALFGTVSGSAVANVLLSGLMTIPLMKRSGFKTTLAGAIEATASTGGQLAPPIMGAAAFILADIVGVTYANVVLAAIVPALLYYISLFALVHFYSLRNNLKPDQVLLVWKLALSQEDFVITASHGQTSASHPGRAGGLPVIIIGGNLWNTGVRAFVLAVPGFLIPYAFAINPAMLLQGPLLESAAVIIPALIGVIALAAASGGYAFGPLGTIMRVALFCAAPLVIAPDRTTDFAGGAVILFVLAYQIWRFKIAGQEKTSSLPN